MNCQKVYTSLFWWTKGIVLFRTIEGTFQHLLPRAIIAATGSLSRMECLRRAILAAEPIFRPGFKVSHAPLLEENKGGKQSRRPKQQSIQISLFHRPVSLYGIASGNVIPLEQGSFVISLRSF
jgi:hypothetical protein